MAAPIQRDKNPNLLLTLKLTQLEARSMLNACEEFSLHPELIKSFTPRNRAALASALEKLTARVWE